MENQLIEIKRMITAGAHFAEIEEKYPYLAKRYERMISELISAEVANKLRDKLRSATLRDWQQKVMDELVDLSSDQPKIAWYVGEGNVGKSWICKYLFLMRGAGLLNNTDIRGIRYFCHHKIVCFDFAKAYRKISYKNILALFNGYGIIGKVYLRPKILIFCHFAPKVGEFAEKEIDVFQINYPK